MSSATEEAPGQRLAGAAAAKCPREAAQTKIARLIRELNDCSERQDPFRLFAATVQDIFPGVCHISLVLFPSIKRATRGGHEPEPPPPAEPIAPLQPPATGARKGPKPPAVKSSALRQHVDKSSHLEDPLTFNWTNSCVFTLSRSQPLQVSRPPDWCLSCSAALHAAAVVDGPILTPNFRLLGPHFADWRSLAENLDCGAVSMASVPVFCSRLPVASVTLASTCAHAFQPGTEATLEVLAAALSPHVQRLEFATRSMQMERLVGVLLPLAAEVAVQQGRFQKVPDTEAGGVTLRPSEQRGAMSGHVKEEKANWNPEGVAAIENALARAAWRPPGPAAAEGGAAMLRFQDPTLHKLRWSEGQGLLQQQQGSVDRLTSSWSDCTFNIISMCIVFFYFSKANNAKENFTTMLLCMAVAAFDVALLLINRRCSQEHCFSTGTVSCIFQVYRVLLLPLANTWMLWSFLTRLELQVSNMVWAGQLALLLACFPFSAKRKAIVHVPLQLISVCFCASTAVRTCSCKTQQALVMCMSGVMWMQMLLSVVTPMVLRTTFGGSPARTFVPHVQPRKSMFAQSL